MGMTDPISDMLTRIRNAQMVGKEYVDVPASRMKMRIAEILTEEGYIDGLTAENDGRGFGVLRLTLKYHEDKPVIERIERQSKPGRRHYVGKDEIPKVYQGLGICVLSTNKGVISDRKARELGVGGEVLFTVF